MIEIPKITILRLVSKPENMPKPHCLLFFERYFRTPYVISKQIRSPNNKDHFFIVYDTVRNISGN